MIVSRLCGRMRTTTIARYFCFLGVLSSGAAFIWNGNDAPPALYRFFVDMYGCGGAMISSRHFITAAHCVDDEDELDMEVTARKVDRVSWLWSNYKRRYPLTELRVAINEEYKKEKLAGDGKHTADTAVHDYAIVELEDPVSVCDDAFGPLALLLPLNPEETAENLVKSDKHHQCIQAGFGRQIKQDEERDGAAVNHMKQMRIRELKVYNFEETTSQKGGTLIDFFSDTGTHSCTGDSGSPIFCIVNDYPIMIKDQRSTIHFPVSLISSGSACGQTKKVSSGGPNIYGVMSLIKEQYFTTGEWEGVVADQNKCRAYYKKNGFLTEYVERIQANRYPPYDEFPDSFVYPLSWKIVMDGSYPVPVTPVPVPVPVPDPSGFEYDRMDSDYDPDLFTSIALKVHVSALIILVAIVVAH